MEKPGHHLRFSSSGQAIRSYHIGSSIPIFLGGLGLFFVGIHILTQNLNALSESRLRRFIDLGSRHLSGMVFCGVFAGFITQSARALYFILSGLVSAGFLSVLVALPILFWGNFGRAMSTLLLVIPLQKVTLVLLGISGVAFAFQIPRRFRSEMGAIFGVALFLFGLDMVREGTSVFLRIPEFQAFLAGIKGQHMLSFFLGMITTFICQSHVGITMIAIAMTQTGVFDQYQILMILYGTHAGSSLISFMLSFQFKGTSRQIVISQVLFNVIGSALFVVLFYTEIWFDLPLVKALGDALFTDLGKQAAFIAVFFNFCTALLLTLIHGPFRSFLERFWPPSTAEVRGTTQYIDFHFLRQPETAILLVEKELLRIIEGFQIFAGEPTGNSLPEEDRTTITTLHQANMGILKKVQAFVSKLTLENPGSGSAERISNLYSLVDLTSSIEQEMFYFASAYRKRNLPRIAEETAFQTRGILESAMQGMIAVMKSPDATERERLFRMVSDKGDSIEGIRKAYIDIESSISVDDRVFLLEIGSQVERLFLALGRFNGILCRMASDRKVE